VSAGGRIVIIGAGCIGAAIAYHLTKRGVRDVIVLDKEPFAGAGSTSAAAGGVRAQFSTPINVQMSQLSVLHYERFADEMGVDPVFFQVGYLFLIGAPDVWASFQEQVAMQRALGVPTRTLSPADAAALVPGLHVDDLLGATFCPKDGLCNPHEITQAYMAHAKKQGADVRLATPVTGIERSGDTITGVRTAGGTLEASMVINAAGPFAGRVAAWAGVELPVRPIRRHCFTTRPLAFVRDDMPMMVDVGSGVYMHRESGGMLMGLANPEEPEGFDTSVNWDLLERVVEPAMHRLPAMEAAEIANAWAGLYTTTPDNNAVLGPPAGIDGLMLANGFSGHGLMHAPAVGQLIAEWIIDGQPSIDLRSLRLERFVEQEAPTEVNVI
jgi:sarcosine oxidase subunit beta